MPEIVGTWRLVATEARDPDGSPLPEHFAPYGPRPMGIATFTADGRMMAVLCDGRPALPDGWPAREYNSYCGNYRFEGETLVTRVDAASDAARFAIDQVRRVSFAGGRMVLQPPADRVGDVTRQRILTWEKVAPPA